MEKSLSVRAEGEVASSSSCCVVEMEKMAEDTSLISRVVFKEKERWDKHCIYRVPEYIKSTTSKVAYRPQFVSLGPLHHGEPDLLPMEQHKSRAVNRVVMRSRKKPGEFVAAIEEVADELEGAYNDLGNEWRGAINRGRFVEMMIMDGCFLLELIGVVECKNKDDYADNDPIFSHKAFPSLYSTMWEDMLAMENQLPLSVLQVLLAVQRGETPDAQEINELALGLLGCYSLEKGMDRLGLHLLDLYRKSYCDVFPDRKIDPLNIHYKSRTLCAVKLMEEGIEFKESKTNSIHDIEFENGVLRLPLFEVWDNTEMTFLNLMAFERLHHGAEPYVASCLFILCSIIESERDVTLLRSKGLLVNYIRCDKKVVEIFNTLTKLVVPPLPGEWLGHVQWMMDHHCKTKSVVVKRRNTWRDSFVSNYLSSPWVFASLVAGFILLVATLLQTVYTIVPFYTKD